MAWRLVVTTWLVWTLECTLGFTTLLRNLPPPRATREGGVVLSERRRVVGAAKAEIEAEVVEEECPVLEISGAQIYESLSHFGEYAGETVVIKYGGHAMSDDAAALCFAQDMVLLQRLGVNPVVVHGGGPQIGQMLEKLQVKTSFVDGLRVTDAATVKVAEMVLCGSINKQIAAMVGKAGGHALGLSGRDDALIVAEKLVKQRISEKGDVEVVDLGFVGDPVDVNADLLRRLLDQRIIPIIAPIASGSDPDQVFSVNADTAAGAVASALGAARLLLLTDVRGVLDADQQVVAEITPKSAKGLVADGVIRGGMLPKITTALDAVQSGVQGAAIVDGRVPHAVLKELFSNVGAGTLIRDDDAAP